MYGKESEGQEHAAISLQKIRFGGSSYLKKNYEIYKVIRHVVNPSLVQTGSNNNNNQLD